MTRTAEMCVFKYMYISVRPTPPRAVLAPRVIMKTNNNTNKKR